MTSKWNINYLPVIVLLLLFISCRDNDETFVEKKENNVESKFYHSGNNKSKSDWISALRGLGYEGELKNLILLVSSSSQCGNCLRELEYWNNTSINEDILLIVVEKYRSRYENFISNNNLSFSSLRDSSAILLKIGLAPSGPIKIYFNENGEITRIHPLGGDSSLPEFKSELSRL